MLITVTGLMIIMNCFANDNSANVDNTTSNDTYNKYMYVLSVWSEP